MVENDKVMLTVLSALVWKYGDIFVDDAEVEHHIVEISFDDVLNFGFQQLEVLHDQENQKTYYRVRKTF